MFSPQVMFFFRTKKERYNRKLYHESQACLGVASIRRMPSTEKNKFFIAGKYLMLNRSKIR